MCYFWTILLKMYLIIFNHVITLTQKASNQLQKCLYVENPFLKKWTALFIIIPITLYFFSHCLDNLNIVLIHQLDVSHNLF